MSDQPKSAYELAMERLRNQDAEQGIEQRSLTVEEKTAIGEVRNFYESKLAELEVLHQGRMRKLFDPAARAELDEQYRRDRARLSAERDSRIEKARGTGRE